MFNQSLKKKAIALYIKAEEDYSSVYEQMMINCNNLYKSCDIRDQDISPWRYCTYRFPSYNISMSFRYTDVLVTMEF